MLYLSLLLENRYDNICTPNLHFHWIRNLFTGFSGIARRQERSSLTYRRRSEKESRNIF